MIRFLASLVCFALISSSSAQEKKKLFEGDRISPQITDTTARQQRPDDFDRKLRLARRLMTINQTGQAADLLESLEEETPGFPVVQNLLRACYTKLKHYAQAEGLARRMLAANPKNHANLLFLAEVLAEQDKRDEAIEHYNNALTLLSSFTNAGYRMVISSMKEHGLETEALHLIDSARTLSGDAMLYAAERGSLLEGRKRYREAAVEYLPLLLEDTTLAAGSAEKRLLALLSFGESAVEVEQLLLAESDKITSVRASRLLAVHYLKALRFDDAYLFSVRHDSLQGYHGSALFRFMNQCEEQKTYDPMLRMATYMIDNDTLFRNQTRAKFYYGTALKGLGRFDEALDIYRDLLGDAPTSSDSSDALYAIGKILMDEKREYDQALIYFDSITTNHRRGRNYIRALMEKPQCHLRAGDLVKARENMRALRRRISGDDILEEIDYHIALIDFFEQNYDSSVVGFRKLMVDFPRGFYVNNALQLLLLIGEAEEDKELLADFARAIYFQTRLWPDSSRHYFQRVANAKNPALADVSLYRLAEQNLAEADSARAMVVLDQLIDNFPDSYYLPFGMKAKADMLVLSPDSRAQGVDLYQALLENHPNYPFISEVRKKLRSLKEKQPIG